MSQKPVQAKKAKKPAYKRIQNEFQKKLAKQNTKPETKGDAVLHLLANEQLVDQTDDDGETPLMNAADAGCLESVAVLLSREPAINARAPHGDTAMHFAARYNDPESTTIALLLIEAGAHIGLENGFGHTPLLLAEQCGNVELQRILKDLIKGGKQHKEQLTLNIGNVVKKHPVVKGFANVCKLGDEFLFTQDVLEVTELIDEAGLCARVQVKKPGRLIAEPGKPQGFAVFVMPGRYGATGTKIKIERCADGRISTGRLLAGYGEYIEMRVSGEWFCGDTEKRGTSFDAAVCLLSQATGIAEQDEDICRRAHALVSVLNGVWLAKIFGIDTRHSAADLLLAVAGEIDLGERFISAIFGNKKIARRISEAFTRDGIYDELLAEKDWQTERELCHRVDAITGFLLFHISEMQCGFVDGGRR